LVYSLELKVEENWSAEPAAETEFFLCATHCMQAQYMLRLFVCPPVRHTRDLCQNGLTYHQTFSHNLAAQLFEYFHIKQRVEILVGHPLGRTLNTGGWQQLCF